MADQQLLMRALSEFAGTLAKGYAISDVLHDLAEQVTSRAANDAGIVAIAGIPMRCDNQSIGALDLYSTTPPRQWSGDDLESARILADMASSYVIHASELDRQRRLNEQLRAALDSRIVIEQAKGILAAERQITVDAAFGVLRRHARRHSATLRSVAEAVVNLDMRP